VVLKPSKFLILLNYRHTSILFMLLGIGEEGQNDPWANKTVTNKGTKGLTTLFVLVTLLDLLI